MPKVTKQFIGYTQWTAPAGVKVVRVTPVFEQEKIFPGSNKVFYRGITGAGYGCGDNSRGALGDNTIVAKSSPVALVGGLNFHKFVSGSAYNFGLTTNGLVYGWGMNSAGVQLGSLGVNDIIDRSSPTLLAGPLAFASLARNTADGAMHAITPSGQVWAWGATWANLGAGVNTARSSPVLVLIPNSRPINKVLSGSASYFLSHYNELFACGDNSFGQLGDSTLIAKSSPVRVGGSLLFDRVWPCLQACLAITPSNELYGWGSNQLGVLGQNDTINRSSPVAIAPSVRFKEVVHSLDNAFALDVDGNIWSWGRNSTAGILGSGSTAPRSSPVMIPFPIKFRSLGYQVSSLERGGSSALYLYSMYAIGENDSVYAWGSNELGQLGTGDIIPRSTPTLVSGNLKVKQMTAWGAQFNVNGAYVVVRTYDNRLYSWGTNYTGNLMLNDIAHRSTPTLCVNPVQPFLVPTGNQNIPATTQTISVTPGTTYEIFVGDVLCQFGSVSLGSGPSEAIIVEYDQ